jgi:ArsR family transcriptional regulator, virulence genes transcriptional regulator
LPDDIKIERLGQKAAEVSKVLKILSSERRLRLLCILARGEQSAGELAENIDSSQSCTSQHLALLRQHCLVNTRSEGTTVYYSLGAPTRNLLTILASMMPENTAGKLF